METGGTGLGIPDSNFCCDGVEGWVEFKRTTAWAVGLRPEQIGWHRARMARGGRSFIAIRRHHDGGPVKGEPVDELWLCRGGYASTLARFGMADTSIMWEGVWSGGPGRWDWDQVRAALLAPTPGPDLTGGRWSDAGATLGAGGRLG